MNQQQQQQQQQLPNALLVDFVTNQVLRLKARNCSSMASNFFKSWSLVFILTTLTFATIIGKSLAIGYPSIPVFKPSGWVSAHATFYGDDGGVSNDMGGACGYGNMIQNGYGTTTAALSTTLFNSGYACGTCYQIKCVQSKFCYNVPYIQVTATNLCPPNWSQDSNNGGWCNPPRVHFDMSKPAFLKIAQYKAGIVPVMYRRVPCGRRGGLRFQFQGNGYWLLVYVMNVGGGGDIRNMWVKGTKTGWIAMTHNWGVSYQAFASLGGQSLSFKLASYTTKEIITVMNVSPASWSGGLTYSTNANFH